MPIVYAGKDGYRDTVMLGGTLDEQAAVTIRVYSTGGWLKLTWPLGSKALGTYGVTWNGTTASGSKVAAGTYLAKATFKDALGHTRTIAGTFTVSRRQARWVDGHGFTNREHPGTFHQVDAATGHWVHQVPLPEYSKFDMGFGIAKASITSSRMFRVLIYCTQTWGDAWDVHRLKATYTYAAWK